MSKTWIIILSWLTVSVIGTFILTLFIHKEEDMNMQILEFYSLHDWEEYKDTFMENAATERDDRFVKAVTHTGRVLGQYGTVNNVSYGVLKERRSVSRLTA